MNSSMLAGERRWASARRGGMTVLGKVAAPKPLNLPSQRLENHGLDPNVEIVPKGTLGWGSRPSSSGSNPWVSSSQSPNVEGGTVSPSHIDGRPSSGGGGTRPSTAGSERTHEPVSGGAWGSNSRPSSASGTLSSNKSSSASLRPSSAENRPNSSQSHLSRFADPMSKNSAAWSPNVPGERMGSRSSKEDGFSLTSGDFPTLGTEKDDSMKITELEGHGRPSSASGRIPHGKDDTRDQTDAKHGTVNTWRADEDDSHPSIEKWHGDNPQYHNLNTNAPPQHFDAWRAPPMSGPPGVWYGARPRGPLPFGPHVGPGRFPMEPFPYYRPQIAPLPLPGSHSKNGDLHRPQMPDAAYARPGMSLRPGFYPGSSGPFESFYGPPMGYERDIPYMGMNAPPPVYNNSYPGPGSGPHIGSSQGRDVHLHHAGKASLDQVEAKDTRGPKRITLKSRNQRDKLEEGQTQEHNLPQSEVSYPEKNLFPILSSRKNEWGAEEDPEEDLHPPKRTPGEYRAHSSDGVKVRSFEGMSSTKTVNDNSKNLPENVPPPPMETARVPLGGVGDSSLPDVMKNSALMHKIDGMNAKIRIYDRRNDSVGAHNREDGRNRSQMIDTKTNNSTGEHSNTVGSFERTPTSRDFVSVPHGVAASVSNKPKQPMIAVSSRPHHGGQVRVEHHGKGKLSSQDADAWRKKSLSTESSSVVTASHIEYPTGSHAHIPADNVEGESVEAHDSLGIQAQRTKMREIVKQRAQQLQKEEEERTKEQRAKALAKLEELNRRSLAGEDGSEKAEKSPATDAIEGEQNESRVIDGPYHTSVNQAGEVVEEMPRNLPSEPDASTNLPVQEDAYDGSVRKTAPQYNNSKHKRAGYKQKQNSSHQKSFAEKYAPNVASNNEVTSDEHRLSSETKPSESSSKLKQNSSLQKSFTEKQVPNVAVAVAANNDITSGKPYPSSEPKPRELNMPNTVVEGVVSQKRKSNRGAKSKHKPDETPLPPLESSIDHTKESIEKAEVKDSSSVSTVIEPEPEPSKAVKAQKVLSSSLPNDESNSNKISSQWRSHPSRRQPRSQPINSKPNSGGDTAVWAPVNKAKASIETSSDTVPESSNLSKGNNNNISKGKRAEMERYVPKHVAKELSQQDYTPDVSVTSSGEVNKHRKDQGVWKQRGPSDSSHTKGLHVESQSVKSDFDSVNAEIKTSVKDRGATDKGKGNIIKGSANTKTDHEKIFRSETDANQVDQSKENQVSSHWQPKSSGSNTPSNQHGNRTESLTFPKKGGNFSQTQAGQSVNANRDPVGPGELTQEDVHLDRNTRRNNRQDNRHEWAPGHDNRPFRDGRQRLNQHYEYQHGGPFKGNRNIGVEESDDAAGGTSQRQRERGQRRGGGNFNRRQSEAAPADRQ